MQPSAISKIEHGHRRVDADDLVALAQALDTSVNSILLSPLTDPAAAVQLTPTLTLDADEAWAWATSDAPASSVMDGPGERIICSVVGRELGTPLSSLKAGLALLKGQCSSAAEQFDNLIDNTDDLIRFAENLSAAATEKVGGGADADLTSVVEEVLTKLGDSPTGFKNISVDLPTALPVRIDRVVLHQVVWNLVDNAVKHSPPGASIRIVAGHVGDEVVLRVRNPGPHLEPTVIRRMFDPFTKRDPSTSGAGFGLYAVRRLIEAHGGRLRMASENGEIFVEIDLWTSLNRIGREADGGENSPAATAPSTET